MQMHKRKFQNAQVHKCKCANANSKLRNCKLKHAQLHILNAQATATAMHKCKRTNARPTRCANVHLYIGLSFSNQRIPAPTSSLALALALAPAFGVPWALRHLSQFGVLFLGQLLKPRLGYPHRPLQKEERRVNRFQLDGGPGSYGGLVVAIVSGKGKTRW